MDKWNQELIDVIGRSRNVKVTKAASVQPTEMITICKKEYMDLKDNKCANVMTKIIRESKAASVSPSINQAQVIHNFLFSKH
jgi:hypothetical protein